MSKINIKTEKSRISNRKNTFSLAEVNKKIDTLSKKFGISRKEIFNLLEQEKEITKEYFPISILSAKNLSSLESVVKYMRENLDMKISEISKLLNRNSGAISITYSHSKEKHKKCLKEDERKGLIPFTALSNRKLSVLESISSFLKKEKGLTVKEISDITGRDIQTIYTSLRRARIKNGE